MLLLCVILALLATGNSLHPIKVHHDDVTSSIRYEAERAFKNVQGDVSACRGLADGYSLMSDESYTIFSVQAPADDLYPVTLHAYSCNNQKVIVDILTNGINQVLGEMLELVDNTTVHNLQLRPGLNTITYIMKGGSIAFDAIEIKGGSQPALRGATLPYETIESENATYQGTLIGPDRRYTTLPSEASQRLAVQLVKSGDYVEFTNKNPFNAIVVRFSIPNTPNGQGQAALLNVMVNGKQVTQLNVTSYFSWVYGSYPFSKNPGDGNPHHFYDETRYFFGNTSTFPGGTKIRLVGASSITYTIDFIELWNVGAAFTPPSGYLSVTQYGADPTGQKDSLSAFNTAIAAAVKANSGVWIPIGKYSISQYIMINGVTIRGAGPWYTELHGNDFGFFGNWAPNPSTNVHLYDYSIFGQTKTRNDGEISSGAGGSYTNSTIQNVWIEHNKCGMWLDGPFDSLHISGAIVRNTFADGINFHKGITNSWVEQSMLRNLGDDALAMWAEQPNNYGSNVFQFNTLALPCLANLIGIYGGNGNSATDNVVSDNIVEGGGLQAGTRYNSVPMSGITTFARNTLIRTGSYDIYNPNSKGDGSIWVFSDSGLITQETLIFQDITVIDSLYSAVMFYQGQMGNNITFSNINVNGAVYLWEERNPGGAYAQGVTAINLSGAGTWICPNLAGNFQLKQGPGNNYPNTTVQGTC